MSNEEILKRLILKHGEKKTNVFCELMADASEMIHHHDKIMNPYKPLESEYDRDWWKLSLDKVQRILKTAE